MLTHTCRIDDQMIIGQRPNPLNNQWNEWTLVCCAKCKKLAEWQHHSEEQMHGGDLFITADVTPDYLQYMYGMSAQDVPLIFQKKKVIRCYDRYSNSYTERYV